MKKSRRTKWSNPNLSHAINYARQNWPVFPIHTPNPNNKGCSCNNPDCKSQGKHPRIKHWPVDASIDEKQIQSWWKKWPDANIGIVTGEKSGFIVLDVDDGGEQTLENRTLPETAESITGNGRHLYFRYPGKEIRNSQKFMDGLDIRGDGGCIVAPPSLHLSGKNYTWESGNIPTKDKFALCPEFILKKAKDSKRYDKEYKNENDVEKNENLYNRFCSIAMNSSDLIDMRIQRPKTIISPWLTDGSITEIYAQRGVGKTFLSLIISIAVTRNNFEDIEIGPWKVKAHAGVLYIDGEMGIYHIKERITRLTLPLPSKENENNPLTIFPSNYFGMKYRERININDPKWRDVIFRYLKERDYYQLLVLDNISSLTSGLDENSNKDWGPINQWLLSMRGLGVAVIFDHHAGKSGQQRGASVREDNVDCVIKLKNASGKRFNQAHFTITFEKSRNVGPYADLKPFALKVEECRTGPGDIWVTENTAMKKADIIMAWLIKGDLRQNQIAKMLDCTESYVTRIKKKAQALNYLDEHGNPTKEGFKFSEGIDSSDFHKQEVLELT